MANVTLRVDIELENTSRTYVWVEADGHDFRLQYVLAGAGHRRRADRMAASVGASWTSAAAALAALDEAKSAAQARLSGGGELAFAVMLLADAGGPVDPNPAGREPG